MLKYVQGDLFNTDCEIIAHGVNCQSKFGSGLAKTITERYPIVKGSYHGLCEHYKSMGFGEGILLGMIQPIKVAPNRTIVNCFTQENYGYDGKQYVDYEAIQDCFIKLKEKYLDRGKTVAIPKIGAGLGGGDWNIIEKIINEVIGENEIVVYIKV
jgi:O-acetyl-ADP-ribose deacetylase (regulator of RNase III)